MCDIEVRLGEEQPSAPSMASVQRPERDAERSERLRFVSAVAGAIVGAITGAITGAATGVVVYVVAIVIMHDT